MTLTNILLLLVFGVFFYMMMKKGGGCCGGHDHGERSGHDGHKSSNNNLNAAHEDHTEKLEATESKIEKDPVCGMDVKNHSIVSKHLGRTFHFCSEQCRKVFDLNPNKYIET